MQKIIKMGYYSERLRQRLENMTLEKKKEVWDRLSYLNEYGPVVTNHTETFYYGEDIPYVTVLAPETSLYTDNVSYNYAA